MKILVDYDACEANGVCESVAPEVFQLDDEDNLRVIDDAAPGAIEKVRQAVASCPRNALTLED
jgi:ferredoxin